jgi:hypothetical protein
MAGATQVPNGFAWSVRFTAVCYLGHDWQMGVTDEFDNPLCVLVISAEKPFCQRDRPSDCMGRGKTIVR